MTRVEGGSPGRVTEFELFPRRCEAIHQTWWTLSLPCYRYNKVLQNFTSCEATVASITMQYKINKTVKIFQVLFPVKHIVW